MSLLQAGQNNGLLMRNSELRPPGLTPLPDTNKDAEAKKKVTMSRMIDHTAMVVEGGKDVAMATITHLAVGITMAEAVGINPIWAMVKAVAVVYPLNHKARQDQCAIDVEWEPLD